MNQFDINPDSEIMKSFLTGTVCLKFRSMGEENQFLDYAESLGYRWMYSRPRTKVFVYMDSGYLRWSGVEAHIPDRMDIVPFDVFCAQQDEFRNVDLIDHQALTSLLNL